MRGVAIALKDKSMIMARVSALNVVRLPTIFRRNARGENP